MSAVTTNEQALLETIPNQLLIGGRWRAAAGGATLGVEDPATARRSCEVADATPRTRSPRSTPRRAQGSGRRRAPRERGEILRRAFEAMTARADELALLMTLEMGKSLAESRAEITYAAEFLRWFAEEAVRIHGRYMPQPDRHRARADDAPAGRAVPLHDAVELPGWRWAPARSGRRCRRLHDGRQAGEADAAFDARARGDHRARRDCQPAC